VIRGAASVLVESGQTEISLDRGAPDGILDIRELWPIDAPHAQEGRGDGHP
jgi:hypothetical protein